MVNGYQYQYDQDNRLTQLKQGTAALVADFTYDALGRRIEKIEYASPSNITTRYTYDGWRVLTETDQADAVQRDYVYGNYIDEAVMMIDADDHYYAHDHLFSVTALLNNIGQVTERYEYNAYGKATVFTDDGADDIWFTSDDTTANTSAQNNPYTFTGQRLDAFDSDSLHIMYYKNRYYDTETGRFLQTDPKEYVDSLNLYLYAHSNPIVWIDSDGLVSVALKFGAFIPKNLGKEVVNSPIRNVRWMLDPKPNNIFGDIKLAFATDDRSSSGFGGSYRIWSRSIGRIDASSIGKLEKMNKNRLFATHQNSSIQIKVNTSNSPWTYVRGSLDFDHKSPTWKFIVKDKDCLTSYIHVWASGQHAHSSDWAPAIDYRVTWTLQTNFNRTWIKLWLSGTHDLFPNYEALVNDNLVWDFKTEGSGPGLSNLTSPTSFKTKFPILVL